MSNPGLGIALATIGCITTAVGYTFQKLAHMKAEDAPKAPRDLGPQKARPAPHSSERSRRSASRGSHEACHREESDNNEGDVTDVGVSGLTEEEGRGEPSEPAHLVLDSGAGALPSRPPSEAAPIPGGALSMARGDPAVLKRKPYFRQWQFSVGIFLLVVGSVFSVIVFGLAGQAQLAPMGAVTMCANSILAWRVLREPFTRIDAVSIILMGTGTTIALVFGQRAVPQTWTINSLDATLNRPIVYIAAPIWIATIIALTVVVRRLGRHAPRDLTRPQAAIDAFGRALVGGMLGGLTGFFVKALVETAGKPALSGDGSPFTHPQPYLFLMCTVVSLFSQVKSFNSGLARYESSRVIPPYQSSLVFSSVFIGYVFWDEVSVQTPLSLALFGGGCCISASGMMVLMWKKSPLSHDPVPTAARGDEYRDAGGDDGRGVGMVGAETALSFSSPRGSSHSNHDEHEDLESPDDISPFTSPSSERKTLIAWSGAAGSTASHPRSPKIGPLASLDPSPSSTAGDGGVTAMRTRIAVSGGTMASLHSPPISPH